jgi:integrase
VASTLAVKGKGKDDTERVDLHPRMAAILTDYLNAAKLKSGPLLPSRESITNGLSSSMVWRIAIAVHRKLGLNGRNLHSYRKAFVTKLIRTGLPLLDVASYSRHASLEMLNVYYNRMEKQKTLPTYYEAFSA